MSGLPITICPEKSQLSIKVCVCNVLPKYLPREVSVSNPLSTFFHTYCISSHAHIFLKWLVRLWNWRQGEYIIWRPLGLIDSQLTKQKTWADWSCWSIGVSYTCIIKNTLPLSRLCCRFFILPPEFSKAGKMDAQDGFRSDSYPFFQSKWMDAVSPIVI